ncbi:MAG: hypothetical protein JJU16_07045 [Alkalibacterium sp.]|nr:hypothetical protein [Alkalibacterium sp.]
MESLNKDLVELGNLLKKTHVQEGYKGLIVYIKGLRNYFKKKYPEYDVSANLYQGYLDLTFFSLTTPLTQSRDLKYIIVFNYDKMQFEVWLSGKNRAVMSDYHKTFSRCQLNAYSLTEDKKGMSAIIEYVVVEHPDFDALDELTKQIDAGVVSFIKSIETDYLTNQQA